MHPQDAVDLAREAMMIATLISAPVLVAGMLVGLIIGLIQALTQIQEQTVAFVPKLVAMVLALGLSLPWVLTRLVEYSRELIENIPELAVGAASRAALDAALPTHCPPRLGGPTMPALEAFLVSRFMVFTLVLARTGALIMTAPIFGSQALPRRVRALLAVTMSLLVTPVYLSASLPPVTETVEYGRLLANEALVGLLLGLGINILFSGVQVAGQIVSQMSGLSLADVFNPGFRGRRFRLLAAVLLSHAGRVCCDRRTPHCDRGAARNVRIGAARPRGTGRHRSSKC